MSSLDTIPDVIEISSGEQIPINIDCSIILGAGESLQASPAPTAAVTLVANGQAVSGAVSGSVAISGTTLIVTVVGSVLRKQQSYYLITTFWTTPAKKLQVRLKLNVIF